MHIEIMVGPAAMHDAWLVLAKDDNFALMCVNQCQN